MGKNNQVRDDITRQPASLYRVCVAGTLPAGWEDRLGGLQIVLEGGGGMSGQTLLMGALRDQAELLGILNILHELHLPLLLVEAVDTDLCPCHLKKN